MYDSNGINPEIIQNSARKFGKEIKIPENFYALVIERHENREQIHATQKHTDLDLSSIEETKRLYFENYLTHTNEAKVLFVSPIQYEIVDEESEESSNEETQKRQEID